MKEYYTMRFKYGLVSKLYAVDCQTYTVEQAREQIALMLGFNDFAKIEALGGELTKIRVEEVES